MTLRLSELSTPSDAIESQMSSGFLELPRGGKQAGYDAALRPFAMTSADPQNQNHLLAALPPAELERLAPELELMPMHSVRSSTSRAARCGMRISLLPPSYRCIT